ncbi:MAG: hypothetical protein R2911_00820 [Caldilineaceae bacterium]
MIFEVIEAQRDWRRGEGEKGRKGEGALSAGERSGLWERLAQIPGVYVPALYEVSYAADGTIAAIAPNHANAPRRC